MTSVLASAAQAAHSAAASILAVSQIKPGGTIPPIPVKEDSPENAAPLPLQGKNLIIGVPGAFTGTCSAQVPGYINKYDQFKAKDIKQIYVVSVNDVFVNKAWKENLAPKGTPIQFISDDKATLTSALGLLFDATPVLGGPRSKRYVIIAEDNNVVSIAVEEDPSQLTVTDATTILAQL